jgi:ribosomal protein S6--L-glutamate ligase
VDNQGKDLRVVVVGDLTKSYFRIGNGSFYNNVAQGGRIDHNLMPEEQATGRSMSRSLCHQAGIDVAGLDIMFPPKGSPLFIEINFLFGRKGIGGRPGYDRLFHQAVQSWLHKPHKKRRYT